MFSHNAKRTNLPFSSLVSLTGSAYEQVSWLRIIACSAFPVSQWLLELAPLHSGGTVPNLHRLPSMAFRHPYGNMQLKSSLRGQRGTAYRSYSPSLSLVGQMETSHRQVSWLRIIACSAFPVSQWLLELAPLYSGGTVPDSHRLPSMAFRHL